jgi:hypothetical protein
MEISIPLNTMNSLYFPIGNIVVVDKKGKIKWVWVSSNKKYNNLRGEPVIFVKPYKVLFYLDKAEAGLDAPMLAISVGPFGYIQLATPPAPPATQEAVMFVEETYNGRAIFDKDGASLKPVLALKNGDYVFVYGEKYFMDIFINKDYDAVTMYQKTPETEDMLTCRMALTSGEPGVEVQDFYKYLSGELPCLVTSNSSR